MEYTVESAKDELSKHIGAVQISGLLVGLFYVSGYYINSMFLINYGIPTTELLRLEYVKIGFVFWLIVCGVALLPFGAFYLSTMIRKTSGLPHYYLGIGGNSLNVIVMLCTPIALSFLATSYEWNYEFKSPLLFFYSFNSAAITALSISTFAVVVLPAIERVFAKLFSEVTVKWLFRGVIEPLRYGSLFLSVYLIYMSVMEVPWLPVVLGKAGPFIAVVLILGSGLLAAYYWVKFIKETEGSLMVLFLISIGFAFFYYLAMASYVFGIYPSIPSNRGGKLPLTQTYLQIDNYDSIFKSVKKIGKIELHGPVYVIEETDKTLYFASEDMEKWFEEFIPINALSKDKIKYQLSERINDGFPKTKRN